VPRHATRAPRPRLPELPRAVWGLQAGGLVNSFGNGLVLPFLLIYLHNVRGMPLGYAGLVAASNSVAALVTGFVAGSLADRLGARRVLHASLLIMAAAIALFPLIRETWHAFLLSTTLGLGSGMFWPSQSTLVSSLAPAPVRHSAFAVQRVTMNLGIALGGLTGGLIASSSRPDTFTVLFLLDACTFLGYAAMLLRLPAPPPHADARAGSYRAVLADRPFLSVVGLNALFMAAAMAVVVELLPPFAKNDAGVSEAGVGVIWFIDSLVVVLAQLPVSRWAEGRRRMAVLALMGAVWATALLIVGAAGLWLHAAGATALMAVAVTAFAFGECLHGTVHAPLSADLAPPALLGRYMAFSTQSWQLGWIVGPAAGGFVLQHAPLLLWPLAAALNLVASAWALAIERRLPDEVRRTPRSAAARREESAPVVVRAS
jgi:MFS family permease